MSDGENDTIGPALPPGFIRETSEIVVPSQKQKLNFGPQLPQSEIEKIVKGEIKYEEEEEEIVGPKPPTIENIQVGTLN